MNANALLVEWRLASEVGWARTLSAAEANTLLEALYDARQELDEHPRRCDAPNPRGGRPCDLDPGHQGSHVNASSEEWRVRVTYPAGGSNDPPSEATTWEFPVMDGEIRSMRAVARDLYATVEELASAKVGKVVLVDRENTVRAVLLAPEQYSDLLDGRA